MIDDPTAGHPRPQLTRPDWQSLDGDWEFAFDLDAKARHPNMVLFDRHILVPFERLREIVMGRRS